VSALPAAEVRGLDAVDEAWGVVGTAPAGAVAALAAVRTAGVRLGEPRADARTAFRTRVSDAEVVTAALPFALLSLRSCGVR
jgi:hypothetical protein